MDAFETAALITPIKITQHRAKTKHWELETNLEKEK